MKRIVTGLLSLALMVCCLAGCGNAGNNSDAQTLSAAPAEPPTSEAPAATPTETGGMPKVAVLWCTMAAPAVQAGAKAADARAAELGIELVSMDAQNDAQKQSEQIANALTQGCDVIILNPVDAKSPIPACKQIKEAGKGLIVIGMQLDESAADLVDCFVGGDDYAVGVQCGNMMMTALPDGGNVAIVEGSAGSDPQIKRTGGFEEALTGSNLTIVDKQNSPWATDKAMSITEDFLIKYDDLAGIFVHDDSMAAGVIEAVKAAGKIGQIQVVSYNGNKIGVAAVKAGEIYGTALQDIDFLGTKSVETSIELFRGNPVEKAYYDNITPITKDNVDEFDPQW